MNGNMGEKQAEPQGTRSIGRANAKAFPDRLPVPSPDIVLSPEEIGQPDNLISLSRELSKTLQPVASVASRIDAILQDRITRYKSGELEPLTPQEYEASNRRLDKKFAAFHRYVAGL
jgi:hypothetical protein